MPHIAHRSASRCCALALAVVLSATGSAAAPASFAIVADDLDPGAPSATLPAGPVDQALADLRSAAPQAVVLVPRREETRGGLRYAFAAWRVQPDAPQWDSIVVVALPEGARIIEATSLSRDIKASLTALIDHALGSAAPVATPLAPTDPAGTVLPLPERWDIRYVVLLERDPAWAAPADPAAAEALTQAHIQYTLRLQRDGIATAAGPLVPGIAADDRTVGMTLLRTADLASAERLAAADPAVKAGRLKVTVREWRVPAGRLP